MNDSKLISSPVSPSCPVPLSRQPTITLAHGGGGKWTRHLIDSVFYPAFENPDLETHHDSALLKLGSDRLALTTDSFVVDPILFPGGNIGTLAVNGTVNDLAMSGARPLFLTAAFILEEGLSIETLQTVVQSMRQAVDASGVKIVTGDTKVVPKGKGDQLFINTTGVGRVEHDLKIHPASIRSGDAVLVSGDIGRHGIAVMAARENLGFENVIESDCAGLWKSVHALLETGIEVHCLRDCTRGGLATALIELSHSAGVAIELDESAIPIQEEIQGACELLGFDPLYVANEGCFVAIVPPNDRDRALEILQEHKQEATVRIAGQVYESASPRVRLKTKIGTSRLLELLSGEQLPRIC